MKSKQDEPATHAHRRRIQQERRRVRRSAKATCDATVVEQAKDVLPEQASHPAFPFVIHELWGYRDESELVSFLKSLPARYAEFTDTHAWLLHNTGITGVIPDSALGAIAQLLITVHGMQSKDRGVAHV